MGTVNILCIYCGTELDKKNTSKQHIIPEVLGGWISIPFLCAECNNKRIGTDFESELKENLYIALAIERLNLQSKKLAYHNASIQLKFDSTPSLKAYFTDKGETKFYPQEIHDKSMIIPEEDAKTVLKKQIERFERDTGKRVNFNMDNFDAFPYDIVIPIYGTDICFCKRKGGRGIVTISDLNKPISFRLPAKIAFEHFAGLYYPFVLKDEFGLIKNFIIKGGDNNHVILSTPLRNLKPEQINYLPYHFVRLSYQNQALSAIVGLFGNIKFGVFIAKLENIDEFPFKDLLNSYHVYDLQNRELCVRNADEKMIENDQILLHSVTTFGLYKTNVNQ